MPVSDSDSDSDCILERCRWFCSRFRAGLILMCAAAHTRPSFLCMPKEKKAKETAPHGLVSATLRLPCAPRQKTGAAELPPCGRSDSPRAGPFSTCGARLHQGDGALRNLTGVFIPLLWGQAVWSRIDFAPWFRAAPWGRSPLWPNSCAPDPLTPPSIAAVSG